MRMERDRPGCKVGLVRPSSPVQARTLALQSRGRWRCSREDACSSLYLIIDTR